MAAATPATHSPWPADPAEHLVVVLGASPKPERYSNQAVCLLREMGYRVIPVHPRESHIEGIATATNLRVIRERVHTLTLYVGADRSRLLIDDILDLQPGRVIFNPGSESPELDQHLRAAGIAGIEGCTLVMLKTRQF